MTFGDLYEAYQANQQRGEKVKSGVNYTVEDDLAPASYPARQAIGDTQRHNLALDCVLVVDELDHAEGQLQLLTERYEQHRGQLEARIKDLRAEKNRLKLAVKYCVIETDDRQAQSERASKMTSLVPPPDLGSHVSARQPAR